VVSDTARGRGVRDAMSDVERRGVRNGAGTRCLRRDVRRRTAWCSDTESGRGGIRGAQGRGRGGVRGKSKEHGKA
jgi:hypothetical protein